MSITTAMRLTNSLRNALSSKSLEQEIEERDHRYRDCAETYQVKPGMFTIEMCDTCRKQAYSLKEFDHNERRELLPHLRD